MRQDLRTDPSWHCMPVGEWPIQDRSIWLSTLLPGDDCGQGGARASHSEFSNRRVEDDYGRWLGWLKCRNGLDPYAAPSDRITRELVRCDVSDLRKNSTATHMDRLTGRKTAAEVLESGQR